LDRKSSTILNISERIKTMRHEEYSPRWDLADRLRNRFDVESYDVYEFHGDNNGDPDSGASDDQTSVSGAAGASTSLPDCAPEDETCHPHRQFQSYAYPGYGPSVPPGYPHGPFVEPDMGTDGFGYIPPPQMGGFQGGGYPPPPGGGVFDRLHHHFRRMMGQQPQAPYGGGMGGQQFGQPGAPGAPPPPTTGLNSFQRWVQIHGMSPTARSDYQNWWQQYGAQGATINGDVQFGGEGSLGDEDLCGGFDMRG
jgi:hypothetical protein